MGPPPSVTGISPKEGPPGTRVTIRGEYLGREPNDVIGKTHFDYLSLRSIQEFELVNFSRITNLR